MMMMMMMMKILTFDDRGIIHERIIEKKIKWME